MKKIEVFVCHVRDLGTKMKDLREQGYNIIETRDKYVFNREGWLERIEKELVCVR